MPLVPQGLPEEFREQLKLAIAIEGQAASARRPVDLGDARHSAGFDNPSFDGLRGILPLDVPVLDEPTVVDSPPSGYQAVQVHPSDLDHASSDRMLELVHAAKQKIGGAFWVEHNGSFIVARPNGFSTRAGREFRTATTAIGRLLDRDSPLDADLTRVEVIGSPLIAYVVEVEGSPVLLARQTDEGFKADDFSTGARGFLSDVAHYFDGATDREFGP
jgi:hypothetical protein